MASVPARRGARGVAIVLAVVALAAGCGGSGYSYHANQDENLYFKLPKDWTVFDDGDLLEGNAAADERMWVRGFTAGPSSVEGVFSAGSDQPRGYVQILTLDAMQRDALSLGALRTTNFGTDEAGEPIDPLEMAATDPDGRFEILDYDDIVLDGPHGVHLRVADRELGGIIDQTVLVDEATTKRYVLSIGCSPQCFEDNKRQIEEVIESWTLEPT